MTKLELPQILIIKYIYSNIYIIWKYANIWTWHVNLMSIFLIDRTEFKTHQAINILLPLILFLASISLGKESYRNFFNIVSFFYSCYFALPKRNLVKMYTSTQVQTHRACWLCHPVPLNYYYLCVLELSPCVQF